MHPFPRRSGEKVFTRFFYKKIAGAGRRPAAARAGPKANGQFPQLQKQKEAVPRIFNASGRPLIYSKNIQLYPSVRRLPCCCHSHCWDLVSIGTDIASAILISMPIGQASADTSVFYHRRSRLSVSGEPLGLEEKVFSYHWTHPFLFRISKWSR